MYEGAFPRVVCLAEQFERRSVHSQVLKYRHFANPEVSPFDNPGTPKCWNVATCKWGSTLNDGTGPSLMCSGGDRMIHSCQSRFPVHTDRPLSFNILLTGQFGASSGATWGGTEALWCFWWLYLCCLETGKISVTTNWLQALLILLSACHE